MKILQIGSYLYPDKPGGAEISAQNFAEGLEERGHKIIRLRWQMQDKFKLAGDVAQAAPRQWELRTWRPFPPLESGPGPQKALFYGLELLASVDAKAFTSLIEQEAIDVILVHSFRGMSYDLLDKIGASGRPVIMVMHDFALVCLNKGMARKGTTCTKLCTVCRHVAARNSRSLAKAPQITVVAPSRHYLGIAKDALGLPGARFEHLPNPNRYVLAPRVRDHAQHLALGFIGRLEADKGLSGLLGIADRLHAQIGMRLVVAGKGAMQAEFERFAAERPWVEYHGFVAAERICEIYDRIDVLALPSLWPENFAGVLVQALGNGAPQIGFSIGGTPEIIEDGITGYVVDFGDFDAVAARMIALSADRNLLKRMSEASLVSFQRYDDRVLRARLADLVESSGAS
jgi:glycosyltransferase involved in cell wall biosynthesis